MSNRQPSDHTVRTIVLVVALVFGLLPLLLLAFVFPLMGMMGGYGGYGPMMGGYGGYQSPGLSPLWGVGMMLVFLVVVLAAGYFLYRGLVSPGHAASADPALEELRLAYARGDLTDDEFESRREALHADHRNPPE